MTKKKLLAEYSRIYDEADKAFKKYNPCRFKDGKCVRNRMNPYYSKKNGCCSNCRKLGLNGCKVKSLGCKLFMCGEIGNMKGNKQCKIETNKLKQEVIRIFGCLPPCGIAKGVYFYNLEAYKLVLGGGIKGVEEKLF